MNQPRDSLSRDWMSDGEPNHLCKARGAQPERIGKGYRVIAGVGVEVDTAGQPDRVLGEEAASLQAERIGVGYGSLSA